MSTASDKLRRQAAYQLRKARVTKGDQVRKDAFKKAASYKALADNEEWLSGEKERSAKPIPKRRK